jgi:hypothetical protein
MCMYWHTCTDTTLKCPMCRQLVNCMLPLFTQLEKHSDDYNRINSEINTFNGTSVNDPNVSF